MKHGNAVLMSMVLALSGCNASVSSSPTEAHPAKEEDPIARVADTSTPATESKEHVMGETAKDDMSEKTALLKEVGGECADISAVNRCFAGDYDLELIPGCGNSDFFAGVSNEGGALLVNRAPPDDTIKIATLSAGQLVCVQAIARAGQDPAYYYVRTTPVSEIPACTDNELCEKYGDRKIQWHVDATERGVSPKGRGSGASGWVDADDLDVFSNGLSP